MKDIKAIFVATLSSITFLFLCAVADALVALVIYIIIGASVAKWVFSILLALQGLVLIPFVAKYIKEEVNTSGT